MFECTSLESHVSNFKSHVSRLDLEVMDVDTLIEEDLCSLLLMSLPTSYTAFQDTLFIFLSKKKDTLFYGHKDLTLPTIYELFSSKEIKNYTVDGLITQAEGLVLHGCDQERKNIGSPSRSKSNNHEKMCKYCKKKGKH